jgi:transposase-like protein
MKANNKKKMRQLYEDWLSGSMSKASFCRQHEINYTTFHYWVKKFRKADKPVSASSQGKGFSRISITESVNSEKSQQPTTVLILSSGARLEFFSPVEASFLKSLLC